ncbi:hypothetical protein L9F63_010654, partial [Diploptera punctata]
PIKRRGFSLRDCNKRRYTAAAVGVVLAIFYFFSLHNYFHVLCLVPSSIRARSGKTCRLKHGLRCAEDQFHPLNLRWKISHIYKI